MVHIFTSISFIEDSTEFVKTTMGALQELSSSEELASFLSTNAFSLVCFSA